MQISCEGTKVRGHPPTNLSIKAATVWQFDMRVGVRHCMMPAATSWLKMTGNNCFRKHNFFPLHTDVLHKLIRITYLVNSFFVP